MKRFFMFLLIMVLFAGCGKPVSGRDDHGHADGLPSFSVTRWGKETELFMEHRALVADKETPFAVHLTELRNFKAMTSGDVTLHFRGSKGEAAFTADRPTSPGIFRPIARLSEPGTYSLRLSVRSEEGSDDYDLGEVRVFKDGRDAAHAAPEEGEDSGISFLKEQQWKADFMVEEVREGEVAATLKTYGQVIAPIKSHTPVEAPVAGTLESVVKGPSLFRAFVEKGDRLATIRTATGEPVEVASPISGIVSRVQISESVEAGARLFEIVDLSTVWVEASVYEPDVAKVGRSGEALVEVPGSDIRIPTKRAIGEGGVFNASSRTLPMIFEVENRENVLRVGSAVTVYIRTADRFKGPVVPKTALVDDGGRFVVYVQPEGESFERREVAIAVEGGGDVGIREGLEPGERVVTKGAYLVKLAASSSQTPSHGHAH